MNQYLIQHKIKTAAYLFDQIEYSGFSFVAMNLQNPHPEDWVASKQIEAVDYKAAYESFRQELVPLLDRLAAVSQCAFSLAASFLILRLNDNSEKHFFFYLFKTTKETGLHVNKKTFDDVSNLIKVKNDGWHYWRLANNSITVEPRLTFLTLAAEALAGKETVDKKCDQCKAPLLSYSRTNRSALQNILGDNFYRRFYLNDNGPIRHRLMHGNKLENPELAITQDIYVRLREYIETEYEIKSNPRIKNTPRSFCGYRAVGRFVSVDDAVAVDLRTLESSLDAFFESKCGNKIKIEAVGEPQAY